MTEPDNDDVLGGWGERLAAARQAAGFTQESLARELDVTSRTVFRWESLERRPNEVDQARIAEKLGKPVYELFPRNSDEAGVPDRLAACQNHGEADQ